MDPKPKAQVGDVKMSAVEGQEPKVTVVATSYAPAPGHWRAKNFWATGVVAKAEVTERQLKQLQADHRIKIMTDVVRPDALVPCTADLLEAKKKALEEEIERLTSEGLRARALQNLRERGAQTAAQETRGVSGFSDQRRGR